MIRALWIVCYALTIVLANWAIVTFGFVPVGFGLYAPAGVYFAGFVFTFRNLVQQTAGRRWGYAAIAWGALLSAIVAPHADLGGPLLLPLASGVAFAIKHGQLPHPAPAEAAAARARPLGAGQRRLH